MTGKKAGTVALLLVLVVTVGCTTTRRLSRTSHIAGARDEAADLVRFVKQRFPPHDPVHKEAELRYAELRGAYSCWLNGVIEAVESGHNPALDAHYSECVERAQMKRDDFVAYIRAISTSGTTPPANPMATLDAGTKPDKTAERVAQVQAALTIFDSLAERWHAFRERYRTATAERRAKEVARLRALEWKVFCENK